MWFFHIVASQKGQSFHEQATASGYFANPLTMVGVNRDRVNRRQISYARDSADPVASRLGRGSLDDAGKKISADRRAGFVRRFRLTGYRAADEGAGLSLARADSAESRLVQLGIAGNTVDVVDGGVSDRGNPADVELAALDVV